MIDRFLGDAFGVLSFQYCSAVWCSAADTHLKLLDRAVSDARFLTGGEFECDVAHRRFDAGLCMLYKIRCNPMHLLMMLYLDRMCQIGLHAVLWSYIGILCAPSLQNLAVPQDFRSPFRVPLERSC